MEEEVSDDQYVAPDSPSDAAVKIDPHGLSS